MGLLKVIEDIENELKMQYLPGAIKYIDEHYANGWSKAMLRLEEAMTEAIKNQESYWQVMEVEGKIYRETILRYIEVYKVFKRGKGASNFLSELSKATVQEQIKML